MFYKEKYTAAFSEESDPAHFQQVYDTEEEAKQFLWTSYSKALWKEFGGWNEDGCIPQHYILPKYKDTMADWAWLWQRNVNADECVTNATDPAILKPLPSHILQKRWQWTQHGGSISTPWTVYSY